MTTLFDITLDVARLIMKTVDGTATGGSATTIVDSGQTDPNDYYTGGTIWVTSGLSIGKSRKVTSFVGTTGTFTFATMTTINAVGNTYTAAPYYIPQHVLIRAVNQALQKMGRIEKIDDTLETVGEQEEYSLPTGIRNIKRVEIGQETTDPYRWMVSYHWEEINGKLYFDRGMAPTLDGYPMRLHYMAEHAALTADTSEVDVSMPLERLRWQAAAFALRWRMIETRGEDTDIVQRLNEATVNAAEMERRYKTQTIKRDPHLARW